MKRLVSISLLAVFLFNVGGYYAIFWGLRSNASHDLISQLDAGTYSPDETILIKLPITLPYSLQSNEYERIDGAFEYKDQYYKLVKQKIESDTLYMLCIKDKKEEKLQHVLTDFTKVANDLSGSSRQALTMVGKLIKEYNPQYHISVEQGLSGWCFVTTYKSSHKQLKSLDHSILTPPPWC